MILLFDLIACPYLNANDKKFKKDLLTWYSIPNEKKDNFIKFVERQRFWYTKWEEFDLISELNSKSSLEPY